MAVRVRTMTARDAADVAALSGQLGYPSTREEIERRFAAASRDPDAALFVAEGDEGRVAGWTHVVGRRFLETDAHAEITGLVVDARTRRRGVGQVLVSAAEDWARQRGYPTIRVRSNTARIEARPFYLKSGYEITKTQYVFRKSLG